MKFNDVSPDRWSAKSIDRVANMGLMGGFPDGTFKPAEALTREQLASVLDRLTFRDGIFTDVLPMVLLSVVEVENQYKGLGSGAVVARTENASYIITNYHVVKDANKIILYNRNTKYDGEIVICDTMRDLALLKAPRSIGAYMALAESDPALGEPVAVIGSPYGQRESVTVGVVSHLDRNGGRWLQTDAPINPGNSGGPIINERGELVAVAVAKTVALDVDNMAYGIKLSEVKAFLEQVKDKII